jgi:hypothetical protein
MAGGGGRSFFNPELRPGPVLLQVPEEFKTEENTPDVVLTAFVSVGEGQTEIGYRKYAVRAGDWSPAVSVYKSSRPNREPFPCYVARDEILVAFESEDTKSAGYADIRAVRSVDGGRTWSQPWVIYDGGRDKNNEDAHLLRMPSGRLLLVHEEEHGDTSKEGPSRVWLQRSSNKGKDWSKAIEISQDGLLNNDGPHLVHLGGSKVMCLWQVYSQDSKEAALMYRVSKDEGAHWTPAAKMVDGLGNVGLIYHGQDTFVTYFSPFWDDRNSFPALQHRRVVVHLRRGP